MTNAIPSRPLPPFRAKEPAAEQAPTEPVTRSGPVWNMDMEEAPRDRTSIFVTADPAHDPYGVLAFWRTTRHRVQPRRQWIVSAEWASVLTSRALAFEPVAWRSAVSVEKMS